MTTLGSKTISREQFMEVCPIVLKQKIDDFFIYFAEKKKSPFSSSSDTSKKFYSKDKFEVKKRPSNSNFRKPFEKDSSEIDKFYINYRGVLSKVNENNQDATWKELLELHLEKYIDSVSSNDSNSSSIQKEISNIIYQYTRSCNMYLKEYIEIINRMKKSKELSIFANDFVLLVCNDIDRPKKDDREYNVLTHSILCECTNTNLVTKKKFIESGLQKIHLAIIKNIEECEPTDENMEIIIQNMKRLGKQINKQKEVVKVIQELTSWKNSKTFSGKIHFNLIDLLNEVNKWNSQ